MHNLLFILCLLFIAGMARLLIRNYHPQAVLSVSGLLMLTIAWMAGHAIVDPKASSGAMFFDLFASLKESLSSKAAKVGLMIMSIGGFVAYMKEIGATEALVNIAIRPLKGLRRYPYASASVVILIGQLLFMAIPSATGLSLLLMASFYPILLRLGVTKISAVAVITVCTAFDMGPASANSNQAASILHIDPVTYFLRYQVTAIFATSLFLMIIYFFYNQYMDRKSSSPLAAPIPEAAEAPAPLKVPAVYALLPVLPLILLFVFSEFFRFFNPPIVLDTTTAMLIALFAAMVFELIRHRNLKKVTDSMNIFWNGMGTVFASVVTLIACAELFSLGLIALGFIDSLLIYTGHMNLGATAVNGVMSSLLYGSSILMGSGNASFFSFSPLVPQIIARIGGDPATMILPMQLASSMGRAVSPISGVVIAAAAMANIKPLEIARRNIIPLTLGFLFMFVFIVLTHA